MVFTKKQLDFLNVFNVCSDTKNEYHDKFQIEAKDGKLMFSQFSLYADLFTSFDDSSENDFSVVYPIGKFSQMLKLCKEDDEIEVSEDTLSFGENSKYQFESFDFEFTKAKIFKDFIENNTPTNTYVIKDLEKLNVVKNFIGNEEGIECISVVNGYFVASDRYNVTAAISTSNDKDLNLYLPKIFLNIVTILGLKEVTIKEYQIEDDEETITSYVINEGNTCIRFNNDDYIIPNIFSDDIKEIYDHSTCLTVDKEKLKQSLKMLKIVAEDNIDNRVFFNINNDNMLIESKDVGYSYEKVSAEVDSGLIGTVVIFSVNYLTTIINTLKGKKVTFQIDPDPDAIATAIKDENEDRIFIQQNYKNIEVE